MLSSPPTALSSPPTMLSSPPTALGGSAFPRIIQKQETHGTQSMGFEVSVQLLLSPQTKSPSPSHCGGWVSFTSHHSKTSDPWALKQTHEPSLPFKQAMERLFDKRPRLKVGSHFAICGEEKQGPDIKGCVFG